MRFTMFCAVLALTGCGGKTTFSNGETEAVDDIRSMQYNPSTGYFDVVCRDGTTERRTPDEVRNDQVCNGGGGGGGGDFDTVNFYYSDSCSGNLLASVRFTDNADWNEQRCQGLSGTVGSNVWGVRFGNGQCYDVADMSFQSACRLFQASPADRSTTAYYYSDSCSGSMVASLKFNGWNDQQICDNAARYASSNVWGVQLGGGGCQDVPDTSFTNACNLYRSNTPRPGDRTVAFYYSDSCSGNLLTTVNFGPDPVANQQRCQQLASSVGSNVWGVRIDNGQCQDIADTSFLNACLAFQ